MGLGGLSVDDIRRFAACDELQVTLLDEVDSTNTFARDLVLRGAPNGAVVIANTQTAGRGRRGHSFYSPPDTGLYLTYVRRGSGSAQSDVRATIAASVAAVEAIKACSRAKPRIKWVNDLYVGRRKVGGILCERVGDDRSGTSAVLVGVGINCHTIEFPEEISHSAGSIGDETLSRNELAGRLCGFLSYWLERLDDHGLMQAYRDASLVLGRTVRYELRGEMREGVAVEINGAGRLVVQDARGGIDVLGTGEVSLASWED